MENQHNQQSVAQDATSYSQDSANNTAASQGGMMNSLTSSLSSIQMPEAVKNIQMPQMVKDFGATCARSYGNMSTTQKIIGGAALALGASYFVANNRGWIGQARTAIKSRKSSTQHS